MNPCEAIGAGATGSSGAGGCVIPALLCMAGAACAGCGDEPVIEENITGDAGGSGAGIGAAGIAPALCKLLGSCAAGAAG